MVGQGYAHETGEAGRCIRAGLRESPLVPHAQTLLLMRQMEDLRTQVARTQVARTQADRPGHRPG